jgi:hypothetical protein
VIYSQSSKDYARFAPFRHEHLVCRRGVIGFEPMGNQFGGNDFLVAD